MAARKQALLPLSVVKLEEEEELTTSPGSNRQVMPPITASAVCARNAASSRSQRAANRSRQKSRSNLTLEPASAVCARNAASSSSKRAPRRTIQKRRRNLTMKLSQAEEEKEMNPFPMQQERTVEGREKAAPPAVLQPNTAAPMVQGAQGSEDVVEVKNKAATGTWRMQVSSDSMEEEDDVDDIPKVRKFEGSRMLSMVDKTSDQGVGSRTRLHKERRRRQTGTLDSAAGQGTFSDPFDLD